MKNINISAFIMSICHPQRIEYLEKTLDYMDRQNFPFAQKVLAIDEFDGYTFPKDLNKQLEKRGWIVLIDNHKSRMKSMDHAFAILDKEYIFYNEEDVQVDMPRIEDIEYVFKHIKVQERACGMISLNLGGSHSHFPENKYGDLNKVHENILLENEDYLVFRRLEKEKNDWFFEFPGLFIPTDLFKQCHETAKKYYPGSHIEVGLTKAWFKENLDKKYYKCSLCKKDILHIVGHNRVEIHEQAKLIKFIDPNQGISSFGGSQNYQSKNSLIEALKKTIKSIK